MSTSKLRAVDMAVLNLFSCANRITIADGVESSPGSAGEFCMGQRMVWWVATWTNDESRISFR